MLKHKRPLPSLYPNQLLPRNRLLLLLRVLVLRQKLRPHQPKLNLKNLLLHPFQYSALYQLRLRLQRPKKQ
jgi:hypothetical protein